MALRFLLVEEVTLPLRFLLKTAHFVAMLTIVFDIEAVVTNMTQISATTTEPAARAEFNSMRNKMKGLTGAALACFGIEYVTLFLGITIFMRGLTGLNIIAHGVGFILTVLFYADNWNLESFIAFFVVFNVAPAVLELLVLLFVRRFSFLKY